MLRKNVDLTPLELNSWRKIALGSWNKGGDPSVYGLIEVDATKILERQKAWAAKHGGKAPSITALVARMTALTFHRYPQVNGLIRFGKIYLRKSVTLFLQTAVDEEGKELSGLNIFNAETKSLTQIIDEINAKARAIREDKDPNFKKAKSTFGMIPVWFMRPLLNLLSFLMYTLNIDLSIIGLPRDPFGSVMITSIGPLGMDIAFAPLVPYSRVPLLLAVGVVKDQALVKNGQLAIAPVFKIGVTFDHRFIDGVYGAKMVKMLKKLLETDEGLDELGLR